MKARVNGCPHKRAQSEGLPIISRREFLDWCAGDLAYIDLHAKWVASGFDPNLVPSIHRVDRTKGYVFGNMMWVSKEEHESLTSRGD